MDTTYKTKKVLQLGARSDLAKAIAKHMDALLFDASLPPCVINVMDVDGLQDKNRFDQAVGLSVVRCQVMCTEDVFREKPHGRSNAFFRVDPVNPFVLELVLVEPDQIEHVVRAATEGKCWEDIFSGCHKETWSLTVLEEACDKAMYFFVTGLVKRHWGEFTLA